MPEASLFEVIYAGVPEEVLAHIKMNIGAINTPNEEGLSPLEFAIELANEYRKDSGFIQGNYNRIIQHLVTQGANIHHINQDIALGSAPLALAAKYKMWNIVESFLDSGAYPDSKYLRNPHGPMPIIAYAIQDGQKNVVDKIIQGDKGYFIANSTFYYGTTPLILATQLSSDIDMADIINQLILAGANVNTQDETGCTALIHASIPVNSNPNTIDRLLRNGADPNIRDQSGFSALMYMINNSAQDQDPESLRNRKLTIRNLVNSNADCNHAYQMDHPNAPIEKKEMIEYARECEVQKNLLRTKTLILSNRRKRLFFPQELMEHVYKEFVDPDTNPQAPSGELAKGGGDNQIQ